MSVNFGPGFHATSGRYVDRLAYKRYLGRWPRLFVPGVLAAAEIAVSHRVLDVETGTGEAAAMALSRVGRSGRVVGGDAYVLSNFVINWRDDEAVVPLPHCRKSIVPHGKLLLVEWIMPSGDEPKEGLRFWDTVTMDLVMLTVCGSGGGHVRTTSEFEVLLRAAGLALAAVVPSHSSVYVMEAVPV